MIEIQQEEGVRLIDEPEDSEKAYHRSGVVFIFLYGILTIYAIFCFYTRLHLFGTQQVDIHKKVIHVCIVVQGICETLYGVSFIVHRQDVSWGYAFHVLAIMIATISFALIPLIWSASLSYGGAFRFVRACVGSVMVINIIVSLLLFLETIISTTKPLGEIEDITILINAAVIAVSLVILSVWMLVYGLRLYVYLQKTRAARSDEEILRNRRKATLRIIVIVSLFVCCYLIRGVAVAIVLVDVLRPGYRGFNNFSIMSWFLFSQWVPFLIPAYLMLHVCAPPSSLRSRSILMGLLRTEWNTSSSRGSQVSLKTMQGPGKAETALSTGAADALRGNEEGRDSGAEEIGHRHDSRFISTESAGGDVESSFLKTILSYGRGRGSGSVDRTGSPLVLSSSTSSGARGDQSARTISIGPSLRYEMSEEPEADRILRESMNIGKTFKK